MNKIRVVFDMETGDPDDIFALCFITSHPKLTLSAVTITPGTDAQVGIVKYILERTNHSHVPVGSRTPGYKKDCVSKWHYNWLGNILPVKPDGEACDVMYEAFKDNLNTDIKKPVDFYFRYLVTGAALTNPAKMLDKYADVGIDKWIGQGGFAGDNVVPEEHRLDKFKGKIICPTYNFNGDPKAAKLMLSHDKVFIKQLVSKNVCHGVKYDADFHKRVEPYKDDSPGLSLIYDGMSKYLKRKSFKAFHDPLAACMAADHMICESRPVEIYREKGQWGSKPLSGLIDANNPSLAFISIKVDMDKFIDTLVTT